MCPSMLPRAPCTAGWATAACSTSSTEPLAMMSTSCRLVIMMSDESVLIVANFMVPERESQKT